MTDNIYGDIYMDDVYEYRNVKLGSLSLERLKSERNDNTIPELIWSNAGITQSRGWVHYGWSGPKFLMFRRVRVEPFSPDLDHFFNLSLPASKNNPQVSEPVEDDLSIDIYQNLRAMQPEFKINPNYLKQQLYVNSENRMTLIQWMIDVGEELNLELETLFLAVNLLDRYSEITPLDRKTYQLVGTACLIIASKYIEVKVRKNLELLEYTDGLYDIKQLSQMEFDIWSSLNYKIGAPLLTDFMNQLQVNTKGKIKMAKKTLLEPKFLKFNPSDIATALAMYPMTIPSISEISILLTHL